MDGYEGLRHTGELARTLVPVKLNARVPEPSQTGHRSAELALSTPVTPGTALELAEVRMAHAGQVRAHDSSTSRADPLLPALCPLYSSKGDMYSLDFHVTSFFTDRLFFFLVSAAFFPIFDR